MDRRSWLWRRKSSEKSPGETESTGSTSSPMFSDDQANLSHRTQSPEITSKVANNDGRTDEIKALTEELTAARLSISAKEELAKQHAKVAEDAVTGWEKAEKELSRLKLQLDAAVKKNSALEDRVGHLDGALKECVRQLRQAREEQDRKLEQAIAKRTLEWESTKSELETRLAELSAQLETAKSEAAASAEKENRTLRLELSALSKKLEVRTLERDLSTKGAESASKQHLESVKKIAKLEAEFRRLRYLTRKPLEFVESRTDPRVSAVTAELDQLKGENGFGGKLMYSSSEIVLMDDFLEMERLAAMPEVENKGHGEENPSKADVEAMSKRGVDLEDKIEKLEAEKLKLEMALDESQGHLQASQRKLRDAEEQLRTSQARLNAAENELIELQTHLIERENQKNATEERLKYSEAKLRELANQLVGREDQLNTSQVRLKTTEANLEEIRMQLIEREDQLNTSQAQLKATEANLEEIRLQLIACEDRLQKSEGRFKEAEAELVKMKTELYEREDQLKASEGRLEEAEMGLVKMKTELHEREDQIKASQGQLEQADLELGKLKTQLFEQENQFKTSQGQVKDTEARLMETQTQLNEWQGKFVDLQTQLALTSKLKQLVEEDLIASDAKREMAELQVKALESEKRSLLARINSLVDEADRERALSAEVLAKCQRLENELSRKGLEPDFPQELFRKAKKAEQEKELTVAASKLADCQKTIASLGMQLKSLATLDEFLLDSDNPLELSGESTIISRTGQLVKMPSIGCQ